MSDSYPWFKCRRTGDEVHADDPACANFADLYGEEDTQDDEH
jgi:transposase